MKLNLTPHFTKSLKKFTKKNPKLINRVIEALDALAEEPYQPKLKTHKLTGKLKDSWACSAGYDVRIVFSFTQEENENGEWEEAILLEDVGTHDDVY
ncbi:MAG: type II toxin-antitoxin system mRNA interferase toxin, RelE/StbE family [Planctomycetes bacterium]|nr:type II toxin-antitoxin system mRNA interferase toxin, RelE/StbE family [Planctomycetota bacterium]